MRNASNILMIRPVNFTFNEQTAGSNAFQNRSGEENIQVEALREFDNMVEILKKEDVNVMVIDDTPFPHTPDSIFPNNWISFHEDGTVFLYPMLAANRRLERKPYIINKVMGEFDVKHVHDLSHFEKDNQFLEGTGSMVLDNEHRIVYACISPRTDLKVLNEFCLIADYQPISFHAIDGNGVPVYHTNVMMCIGSGFAVICLNSIHDKIERESVEASLKKSKKEIIEISLTQLNKFAGNMIQLTNKRNEHLLLMSEKAYTCLSKDQISRLEKYGKLVHTPLDTIENNGGGSARCMIAEINMDKLKR
ncbi:MAG TPA: arginine deiminase-related protein [Sphingobacteriaceae bacterium]